MEEKEGYYFEIRFNPETKEMTTDAKIPLGQMARGIGATLSKLDLTGEDFKSLTYIASGGEVSRIMLSIKLSLQETVNSEVLVFDEVVDREAMGY